MKEFKPLKEKKYRCPRCRGALNHIGFCDSCKALRRSSRKKSNRRLKFREISLKR